MTKGLIIFGFGYCAEAVLHNLHDWDGKIIVITRNVEKINLLRKRGVEAYHWSDQASVKECTQKNNVILHSVPPVGNSDPVYECFVEFFSELPDKSKFIYLSSTGVYGDRRGNWVDETAKLNPKTELGIYRLYAEKIWKKIAKKFGLKLTIMRLAGIYGLGRSPMERLQKGKARVIRKPGLLFSRIHVDDIVELIRLCIERDNISGIYNICDNKPASSETVMKEASRLLGIDCPAPVSMEKLDLSKKALDFYSESKKVSNKKLLKDFRYEMKHPDYFSGLKAIANDLKRSEKNIKLNEH